MTTLAAVSRDDGAVQLDQVAVQGLRAGLRGSLQAAAP